jgi:hypothetical protein
VRSRIFRDTFEFLEVETLSKFKSEKLLEHFDFSGDETFSKPLSEVKNL